jgi:hypothetical protein
MKQYSLRTMGLEHTLPIPMGNVNRYIKFKKVVGTDPLAFFDTSEKKLQTAIEKSQFFESGEIKLVFSNEEEEKAVNGQKQSPKKEVTPKKEKEDVTDVFTDVTTFGQAKNILTGDPYNIAKTSPTLSSPAAIFKQASELGISFPNLPEGEE